MMSYRLIHSVQQFSVTQRHSEESIVGEYEAGDATALDFDDVIKVYSNHESALSDLRKRTTDIYRRGNVIYVDEYGVDAVNIDEDRFETDWEYVDSSALPAEISLNRRYALMGYGYEEIED